jgi:hypothetical protein
MTARTPYDEKVDALLEAWAEERERANRAELRVAALEVAAFRLLHADTIEDRSAALDELAELIAP